MSSNNNTNRSLFFVDDEPLILETYGQLLRTHLNCDVHTFESPTAALQQLINLNPGMIITDFSMPGMNGLKFLAHAQKYAPETNFVVITGGTSDFSAEDITALPTLKGILRKPIHWKVLAKFVIDNWPDATRPTLHPQAVAC